MIGQTPPTPDPDPGTQPPETSTPQAGDGAGGTAVAVAGFDGRCEPFRSLNARLTIMRKTALLTGVAGLFLMTAPAFAQDGTAQQTREPAPAPAAAPAASAAQG